MATKSKLEAMPTADDAEEMVDAGENLLEVVDEQRSRTRRPLIEGAVVIYKGTNRKKVVALNGRVYVQEIETGDKDQDGHPVMYVTKECGDEGTQSYSFMTHDSLGKLIKMWLTPMTGAQKVAEVTLQAKQLPEALRGRPFTFCEHPEHLRVFLRMRNAAKESEFTILVPPKSRQAFNEYVRLRESRLGYDQQQLDETTA
jgi:hypothetical protein